MSDYSIVTGPPRVFVVAVSQPHGDGFAEYLQHRSAIWNRMLPETVESIVEAAGRVCYQSWENKRKLNTHDYLQSSIIDHGHGSVLEHLWFNCLVADLPRSVQLELVRHGEGTAFSFESQRFTDKNLRFVVPPLLRSDDGINQFREFCAQAAQAYTQSLQACEYQIDDRGLFGDDKTLRRKRAKEAARSLLPNCVGSDGMFSVNARAARHIIELRSDEHADASIREFAVALYDALVDIAPAVFADAQRGQVSFGPPTVAFKAKKV